MSANAKDGAGDAKPTQQQYSEPEYASSHKDNTQVPWHGSNIDKYLAPGIGSLLENYSKVPADQQPKHVHEIRDRAWAIRQYPCIGLGVWLVPYISHSPAYKDIIEKLKNGGVMVDIGCFVGGDFRQLVYDGAPSDRMFGVDLVSHWEVGYDLFRDKDKFKATFIEADLMAVDEKTGKTANAELAKLEAQVDVISISAVLHQWDWDAQIKACKRLVVFSKVGSIVVGHQMGKVKSQETMIGPLKMRSWSHDPESFKRMWDVVGEETGTRWETQAWSRTAEDVDFDPEDMKFLGKDVKVLDFVVTRTR